MDYQALRTLIETHPSWPGVTDEDLVVWCNDDTAVTRDRETVASTEVFTEVLRESAEWTALTAEERQEVRDILTVWDEIPTQPGDPARARLIAILGPNTTAAVGAIIPEDVSRAVNAGLGVVIIGDVQNARAL